MFLLYTCIYVKEDLLIFSLLSWDEMAKYDIPAVIEYVLEKSGKQQLYFIGHSQGTLQAFAAFSQNATLSKKVRSLYVYNF